MASEIYLAEDGQQIGPLTEQQVRAKIEKGEVNDSTYAWIEGAPDWKPIAELLPELFAMTIAVPAASLAQAAPAEPAAEPAPAPVEAPVEAPAEAPTAAPAEAAAEPPAEAQPEEKAEAPAATPERPSVTTFEIGAQEDLRIPRLTLDNAAVVIEASALHYARGAITTEPLVGPSGAPEGNRLVCRGTGLVCLTPTAHECAVQELSGETWILDEGALLACDHSLTVATVAAGEGLLLTKVSGSGKLVLRADGPIERLALEEETLLVNGPFAVARSAEIALSVQRAGRSVTRKLHGTGTVLLAPVPHRAVALAPPPPKGTPS